MQRVGFTRNPKTMLRCSSLIFLWMLCWSLMPKGFCVRYFPYFYVLNYSYPENLLKSRFMKARGVFRGRMREYRLKEMSRGMTHQDSVVLSCLLLFVFVLSPCCTLIIRISISRFNLINFLHSIWYGCVYNSVDYVEFMCRSFSLTVRWRSW